MMSAADDYLFFAILFDDGPGSDAGCELTPPAGYHAVEEVAENSCEGA
jgi:hypothetical protein